MLIWCTEFFYYFLFFLCFFFFFQMLFKCFFLNLYCLAHTADISLFLCSMNGALAFVDSSDCTIMYIAEHYMASDVEWDPTGRYVVTSVSWWSHKVIWHVHLIKLIYVYPQSFFFVLFFICWSYTYVLCIQVDNAYWLWTFQGRLLQKNNKDRFCQLLWRPRPPTLLSQEQIKVTAFSTVHICNVYTLFCIIRASPIKILTWRSSLF